jgi:hypothetical protein
VSESKNDPLRLDFDRQLKLEFHGSTVTSDAGLLAYRELDDTLGLTCTAATDLHDTRTGQNTRHAESAATEVDLDRAGHRPLVHPTSIFGGIVAGTSRQR